MGFIFLRGDQNETTVLEQLDTSEVRERCIEKKVKKEITSVSFAFTYMYIHSRKINTFTFFPKRTWKILKNVQNAKEKTFHFITLSQEQL